MKNIGGHWRDGMGVFDGMGVLGCGGDRRPEDRQRDVGREFPAARGFARRRVILYDGGGRGA